MGILAIIGIVIGLILICLIISVLFWVIWFLIKTKWAEKSIPEDIDNIIELAKLREKEVENVRESNRIRKGKPVIETRAETSPNNSSTEPGTELQIPEVVNYGEPELNNGESDRSSEEDWPEFE